MGLVLCIDTRQILADGWPTLEQHEQQQVESNEPKKVKSLPKICQLYFSLLTVDNFHVLLSFATYLIRFNTVRPWDKVLLQLHESIIIFHIKHIRRISLGCLTMLVRLICVYLRKRIVKVGHELSQLCDL